MDYYTWARSNQAWEALAGYDIQLWEWLIDEDDLPTVIPANTLLAYLI